MRLAEQGGDGADLVGHIKKGRVPAAGLQRRKGRGEDMIGGVGPDFEDDGLRGDARGRDLGGVESGIHTAAEDPVVWRGRPVGDWSIDSAYADASNRQINWCLELKLESHGIVTR
ncbi:hypothetical protein [Brevundimonas sp.]|uniref:hypothetical protein n=1 Tax=Brevundimonas sp. TaxID=1871086 RepID=UPI001A1CACEA|nr:hypothetical protein [Brevundimonas sp.]MBJ7484435.1 hypothetical protein [Brevundimonas sp.]